MKKRYALLLLAGSLFTSKGTFAQMVGDCDFLQGNYVEVGVSPSGSFGTTVTAPAGYHVNSGCASTFTDPATGASFSAVGSLGFVADPAMDGWTTGTPYPYWGDYFVPGDPQEGWSIQVNGQEGDAWTPNFSGGSPYSNTLGASMTGTTFSYYTTPTTKVGVWRGTVTGTYPLQITQTTTVYTNKLYFTIHVVIKNTGGSAAPGLYYLRTVDPDNGEPEDGSFTTSNTIQYQLPNANNDVMVTATDPTYSEAFMGLGTRDCRAKCFIIPYSLTPGYNLNALYNETASGYFYTQGDNDVNDEGIGLVYNLGSLAAGDSTDLTYAYVLRAADLDSALAITSPTIYANGALLSLGSDTLNACSSLSDTLPVSVSSGEAYTWTWSPATGLSATTGSSVSVILTELTSAVTYTVIGTPVSASLCSNDTFHFTMLPGQSMPPVVNNVQYCLGDSASALVAYGTNLLWYTAPSGGVGSSTAPVPSTAATGVFTYYVTQTTGACTESIRVPVTVTVTALPVVTASSNTPVCQGNTLSLSSSATPYAGGTLFTWTGPGLPATTGQNITVGGVSMSAAGVYTVSANVNGCIGYDSTSVEIVAKPFITNATPFPPSECRFSDGHIILFGLTPGAGYSLFYDTSALSASTPYVYTQGAPYTADSAGDITISNVPSGNYYNMYVTNWNGCQSNIISVNVHSGAPITAPTLSSNGPICQDSLLLLFASDTVVGSEYSWLGPNGFSSNLQDPSIANATPATIGTYTCVVTKASTGCQGTASITVTYKPTPVFSITSLPAACQTDTLTMNYSGPSYPGATYLWQVPIGSAVVTGGDSISGPVGVEFDSAGHTHVMLTVTLNGCSATDTQAVYVVPTPLASLFITPDICQGDTVTAALSLTSYSPAISHYSWDFDSATVVTSASGTGGPYSIFWSTPGIKVVDVTAYTLQANCPSFTRHDTVKVHPYPDASFTGTAAGCAGDSIVLTATSTDASYSYLWSPSAFFVGALNAPNAVAFVYDPSNIYLTVTSPFGCTATDSVMYNVMACCTVTVPEAFSPNADGHNDYFRPLTAGHHQLNDFRVTNRWGTTVYESVNTDAQGWDGTYNGVPQDVDTYYWYLRYTCDGRTYESHGDVTLVR